MVKVALLLAAAYRFVAWNVWEDYKGNPVAERADRQVAVLRQLRPDFLSLQEFDRGFWRRLACLPRMRSACERSLPNASRFCMDITCRLE